MQEREYQDFPSENFCHSVPNNFVEEPFSVSLIRGMEKLWIRKRCGRGSIKTFRREIFVTQYRISS